MSFLWKGPVDLLTPNSCSQQGCLQSWMLLTESKISDTLLCFISKTTFPVLILLANKINMDSIEKHHLPHVMTCNFTMGFLKRFFFLQILHLACFILQKKFCHSYLAHCWLFSSETIHVSKSPSFSHLPLAAIWLALSRCQGCSHALWHCRAVHCLRVPALMAGTSSVG